jgi:CRP-like cAMP-binding protein
MDSITHFSQFVHRFVQPTPEQMALFLAKTQAHVVPKNETLVRAGGECDRVWERFGRLTTALYLLKQMQRSTDLLFKTGKEKYDAFIQNHPEALQHIPLHQIADFIGVQFETLSRIRNRRN